MDLDPIVKEVREAGAKMGADAGNDVHHFFENLRQAEKKYGKPLVQEKTSVRLSGTGQPAGPQTAASR